MIRDTFFSLPRFVDVCRKEMVESWKVNLLRVVLMYGTLAIVLVWNAYVEYEPQRASESIAHGVWSFGVVAFIWGIIVWGCLSASFTMERMKTKTQRMAMLMTPATMFEKFWGRWLVFTFGFLLVYLLTFKLADWTRMLIFMVQYPEVEHIGQVPLYAYLSGNGFGEWANLEEDRNLLIAVSGYFFLQSCFVLGSAIWPKNAFMKTFAALVCIGIVYLLVGWLVATSLFNNDGPHYYSPSMPSEDTVKTLIAAFFSLMALFNWVLAYFRFKESEIIHRW